MLHLAEFVFPIAGQARRVEALDLHLADEVDEAHAAAGDVEFAAVAGEVFLGDEALDGGGAGGGCAEAALGHGFAQGFVIDEFPGAFHGGEQGGLGHAGRRLGFLVKDLDGLHGGGFTGGDGHEFVLAGGDSHGAAIDFEPAGLGEDAAVGPEGVGGGRAGNAGQAGGLLELGGRIENGDEAFHDHVVNLLLGVAEFGDLAGGDDGEVIGDLLVIEDAAELREMRAVVSAALEHGVGVFGNVEVAVGDVAHRFADVAEVIFRQVAGIGPRIGEDLVLFIKRLGDLKGALGGKRGLALEGGEVVELRGDLGLRFFLFGDDAGLAFAAGLDGLGGGLLPDAFGSGKRGVFVLFPGLVDPLAGVFAGLDAEAAVDLEIRSGPEGLDFRLAGGEDGERGGLDAAGGGDVESAVAGVEAGEGAGGVEADEPVRLRAALGGVGEGFHLLGAAQVAPGFENGVVGHRLHPEPLHGLLDVADFHDVVENEFALAAGVAGIDDAVHVLALGELEDLLEAGFRALDGIEIKVLGDGREDLEIPRKLFAVGAHRHAQLDEVADGGGDDGLVIFKKRVAAGSFLFEFSQRLGERAAEIGHDAGFLGNDQCFSHD